MLDNRCKLNGSEMKILLLLYEQHVVPQIPYRYLVRYVSKFDSSTVGTAVPGCSSFATIMNFYNRTMARVNIFEIVIGPKIYL